MYMEVTKISFIAFVWDLSNKNKNYNNKIKYMGRPRIMD